MKRISLALLLPVCGLIVGLAAGPLPWKRFVVLLVGITGIIVSVSLR